MPTLSSNLFGIFVGSDHDDLGVPFDFAGRVGMHMEFAKTRAKSLVLFGVHLHGFVPESRAKIFKLFRGLEIEECPFANLPEPRKGRWGEGFTAEDMTKCRWLKPRLVAQVEFAEWTPAKHLRHSKFIALRDDKEPRKVHRESR